MSCSWHGMWICRLIHVSNGQQPVNLCMQACHLPLRPCLQILESVIKFRWAALPAEQREGIKNYTSNLIIKYSTNEQLYRSESTFINKLNLILVQILKQVRFAVMVLLGSCCSRARAVLIPSSLDLGSMPDGRPGCCGV